MKFHEVKVKGVAVLLLAFAAGVYSVGSSRAETPSAPSYRVSIAGIDRHSPAGVHRIYVRLEAAANWACGTSDGDTDVLVRGRPSECVRDALARAVRDVRSPELAQLYIERNGADFAMRYGFASGILSARQ